MAKKFFEALQGLVSFEEAVIAFGDLCRGDSACRLRIIARAHQPPAYDSPKMTENDSEKYMIISQQEIKPEKSESLTDSTEVVGKVELSGQLLTNTAKEDFFPESGEGDVPRGNRLGPD